MSRRYLAWTTILSTTSANHGVVTPTSPKTSVKVKLWPDSRLDNFPAFAYLARSRAESPIAVAHLGVLSAEVLITPNSISSAADSRWKFNFSTVGNVVNGVWRLIQGRRHLSVDSNSRSVSMIVSSQVGAWFGTGERSVAQNSPTYMSPSTGGSSCRYHGSRKLHDSCTLKEISNSLGRYDRCLASAYV